jgi:hypothetical protein
MEMLQIPLQKIVLLITNKTICYQGQQISQHKKDNCCIYFLDPPALTILKRQQLHCSSIDLSMKNMRTHEQE